MATAHLQSPRLFHRLPARRSNGAECACGPVWDAPCIGGQCGHCGADIVAVA